MAVGFARACELGVASGAVLVALSLACSPDEAVPREEAVSKVRAATVPAELERGSDLYSDHCADCHGLHGEGGPDGPPMLHPLQSEMHGDFAFERALREGVKPHHYALGTMPPIPGLDDADVTAIVRYVRWMQEVAGLR